MSEMKAYAVLVSYREGCWAHSMSTHGGGVYVRAESESDAREKAISAVYELCESVNHVRTGRVTEAHEKDIPENERARIHIGRLPEAMTWFAEGMSKREKMSIEEQQ